MILLLQIALIPVAIFMMFSPIGRLFVVVGTAMVVFTPGFAPMAQKIAFITILLVSSAIATVRLRTLPIRPSGTVVAAAIAFIATLIIGAINGNIGDPQATLQNGLPYAITLLILPIAVDAGQGTSRRTVETGIVLVGVLATLSFTLYWLTRRAVSSLDVSHLLAASMLMPAFVFQWGLVTASEGSHAQSRRVVAITMGFFAPIALLVSGTRSSFVFAFGVLGFLIWGLTKRRIFRAATSVAVAFALALPAMLFLGSYLLTDTSFIFKRLSVLSTGVDGDQSWIERQIATQTTQALLDGNWLFGLGLSTPNPLINYDTPLSPVMRIGLVGVFFFVVYLVAVVIWSVRVAAPDPAGESASGIFIGWSMIVAGFWLLIPPVEDTLFPFAFGLAVLLAVNSRYCSDSSAGKLPEVSPIQSRGRKPTVSAR